MTFPSRIGQEKSGEKEKEKTMAINLLSRPRLITKHSCRVEVQAVRFRSHNTTIVNY